MATENTERGSLPTHGMLVSLLEPGTENHLSILQPPCRDQDELGNDYGRKITGMPQNSATRQTSDISWWRYMCTDEVIL